MFIVETVRELIRLGAKVEGGFDTSSVLGSAATLPVLRELFPHCSLLSQQEGLVMLSDQGNVEAVQELLRLGVDVHAAAWNEKVGEGRTPLLCAVEGGHVEVIKKLIAHGALNAPEGMQDPLEVAIHNKAVTAVEELLQHTDKGVDLTRHYLRMAVEANSPEIIRLLAKAGVDVNKMEG